MDDDSGSSGLAEEPHSSMPIQRFEKGVDMSSIEPSGRNNPPVDRDPRDVVPVRPPSGVYVTAAVGCSDRGEPAWLESIERLLDSWPRTVRGAVLLIVLFAGLAVLAAALGAASVVLLAMLGRVGWHER